MATPSAPSWAQPEVNYCHVAFSDHAIHPADCESALEQIPSGSTAVNWTLIPTEWDEHALTLIIEHGQ